MMRFVCDYCGCEFEIDKKQQQVKSNPQVDIVCGCEPYYTRCPECGLFADGDYVK